MTQGRYDDHKDQRYDQRADAHEDCHQSYRVGWDGSLFVLHYPREIKSSGDFIAVS